MSKQTAKQVAAKFFWLWARGRHLEADKIASHYVTGGSMGHRMGQLRRYGIVCVCAFRPADEVWWRHLHSQNKSARDGTALTYYYEIWHNRVRVSSSYINEVVNG